jgi:hypothetical protein
LNVARVIPGHVLVIARALLFTEEGIACYRSPGRACANKQQYHHPQQVRACHKHNHGEPTYISFAVARSVQPDEIFATASHCLYEIKQQRNRPIEHTKSTSNHQQ